MSSPSSTATSSPGRHAARVPFLAFTSDADSAALLRRFAAANGWPEDVVRSGDIAVAAEFLKSHPSPQVLCVDLPSAEAAPAQLDALADVCDPGIKVIASGKINEYSFYCWLVEVGISNYLLKPFTLAAVEAAYRKATDVHAPVQAVPVTETRRDAKIITVLGTRGGVGASTVSVNIAWALSHELQQNTALLDFDPQLGTVALALDLEPGKGLRDALEKPERIDGLFLDRVMVKIDERLSILSTEESLEEHINPAEAAAEALFKQIRPKFAYVVIDLPRALTPYSRYAIRNSDTVIFVTELTLTGLRESLRYLDYCRDHLKIAPPIFVANRLGLAGKHQMPQAEFEKGLGAKIDFKIPFALEAHAAATVGEVMVEMSKNTPATQVLRALAASFVPEQEGDASQPKKKGLSALFKGGK